MWSEAITRASLHRRVARRGTRFLRSLGLLTTPESVLLNTMPKSGSVYVATSLAEILGHSSKCIGNRYALIDQLNVEDAVTFSRGGFVSQNHLAPSQENLQILQHLKLKMVLHLRDPRQALLSWVHHINYISGRNNRSEELLYFPPRLPRGYFELSLSDQIDWQIETHMPKLVLWMERWLEIADRGTIPILITHQNDLKTDEKAFFDTILAFYQIDLEYTLPNLPRTMSETHFRLADPMEWTRVFTPDQAAWATSLVPPSLSMRFGWNDPLRGAVFVRQIRRRA